MKNSLVAGGAMNRRVAAHGARSRNASEDALNQFGTTRH